MASNPIQKKVRNAALVGVLITVLIMGSIVAFLLMQISKVNEEKEDLKLSMVDIYSLSENLQSGDILTEEMLTIGKAQRGHIPSNAIIDETTLSQLRNYSLSDREGNRVYTDPTGEKFLRIESEYTVIYQEKDEEDKIKYYTYGPDAKNEKQKTYITINNENTKIFKEKFDNGMEETYILYKSEEKTRLYCDENTGNYFIHKIVGVEDRDQDGKIEDGEFRREKVFVDILGTPYIAKININENTIITSDMLALGELLTDDIRKQEYNAVVLPTDLTSGDYIDIRMMLPNGQDFVVLSKKMVELPMIDGMESETTIWLEMSEDEILTMSCAIVEAYRINGSKLYATKYKDPGYQEAAEITYPISAEVRQLIISDPNVTEKAEYELQQRYTNALKNIREEYIHKEMEKDGNSADNVPGKINESVVKTQEERKKYLQSIANGY